MPLNLLPSLRHLKISPLTGKQYFLPLHHFSKHHGAQNSHWKIMHDEIDENGVPFLLKSPYACFLHHLSRLLELCSNLLSAAFPLCSLPVSVSINMCKYISTYSALWKMHIILFIHGRWRPEFHSTWMFWRKKAKSPFESHHRCRSWIFQKIREGIRWLHKHVLVHLVYLLELLPSLNAHHYSKIHSLLEFAWNWSMYYARPIYRDSMNAEQWFISHQPETCN